ncbi:conjugal transfer mating-pair stabilization protein TraG [Nissabacter sp. SGAir0207]|uniref:conjugal transfer mating-pair stabilization protein TraG n=1 Tax=Nissabacter sp. SGAir0207 TaxID=2126321 RepID=UPI0010CD4D45|nr:conjugal transfer mating-pair stabilization protein TraG [Nissabacter sp. SGAir0207]QCR38880.1 conjugal transfer protein TraG [Nissabacter sp. SGAir0207]
MDTIYTISGGAWYRDSLNAVATFMQSSGWETIASIAGTLSVVATAIAYIKGRDLMLYMKWMGALVLVTSVLINVKRPVQIIDLSAPTEVYQVDNVPVGISGPFSLITSIGHNLVEAYELVFHQPDALSYSKTGMLFGADLMGKSTDFLSTNPQITALFSSYVQNCVVGDIMLNHKYTLYELMNTTDPYSLIFSRPSPLRGVFDTTGTFQTCEWAAAQLQQVMGLDTQAGGETYSYYVRRLMGGRPDATPLFAELMGDSYSYFYGASQTASDIMKQNVTMSALRKGISSVASRSGDTASLVNLSTETSYSKLRMSQATAADIATRQLPIMQTVLMGILIGMFPIVIALALINVLTLNVLMGYVYSIVYLQSWPLLFAILNNAMNFYLQSDTAQMAVTLSNLSRLQQVYSDIGTTAGWLALSIPFLAAGIVFGMHKAVSQAGSYLGSAMQGASTQSASQAVDGTWAFNNMQTDNVNGFKWDTNSSFANGQMTSQTGSGAMKTITNDGNSVYNAAPAMSKLATDINFGHTASATAQRLARESQVEAESSLSGFNHTSNTAYNQAKQFSSQAGNSSTVTSGADSSQGTSETQGVNQMLSAAQSYAERNHISESQAWNELMDKTSRGQIGAGIQGSVNFNSDRHILGKIGGLATGVAGQADVHAKADLTKSSGSSDNTSNSANRANDNSADHSTQEAKDFKQGMDAVQSYRTNQSGSHANNQANSLLEQLGTSFSVADSQYQQYTTSLNRSHEYSQMASASDTTSASVQGNYAQEFVHYVQEKRPEQADQILTNTENESIRSEREQLAGQFMEEKMRGRVEGQYNSDRNNLNDGLASVEQPSMNNISSAYQKGEDEINERASSSNIRSDSATQVDALVDKSNEKIANSNSYIDESKHDIQAEKSGLSAAHAMAEGGFNKSYGKAMADQGEEDPQLKKAKDQIITQSEKLNNE